MALQFMARGPMLIPAGGGGGPPSLLAIGNGHNVGDGNNFLDTASISIPADCQMLLVAGYENNTVSIVDIRIDPAGSNTLMTVVDNQNQSGCAAGWWRLNAGAFAGTSKVFRINVGGTFGSGKGLLVYSLKNLVSTSPKAVAPGINNGSAGSPQTTSITPAPVAGDLMFASGLLGVSVDPLNFSQGGSPAQSPDHSVNFDPANRTNNVSDWVITPTKTTVFTASGWGGLNIIIASVCTFA